MATLVDFRELRNDTRGVLSRVEAGEDVAITVDGRRVAELRAVPRTVRLMGRDEFVARFSGHQADAALAAQLTGLARDTTDDLA